MALIGKIRKHSALIVIIVGIALAAFVLGDFLNPWNNGGKRVNTIGSIDGDELMINDFNQKVEQETQLRKEQQKKENFTPDEQFQIRQTIWNQMVNDQIMGKEYEKLGIIVSVDELNDMILGATPHRLIQQSFTDPNTGQFDPKMVRNFLDNLDQQNPDMKDRYLMIEKYIKEDRIKTKYNNLVQKAYYIPKAFAQQDYIDKTRNLKLRVVAKKYMTLPDSLIKLTDADYKAYYEENIKNYEQEEMAEIDYVVFEVKPSQTDRDNIAAEVAKITEEFNTTVSIPAYVNSMSDDSYDSTYKAEAKLSPMIAAQIFASPVGTLIGPVIDNEVYNIARSIAFQERPDSIKMSQLLVAYKGIQGFDKVTRTKDQAKVLADSILNVLKKSPDQFEILALAKSDYPTVQDDKGDLKWMIDGDPNFSLFFNAGIPLKVNDVKVIESRLGYHVIKTTEKTKPIRKVQVGIVTRKIEPSQATFQDTYLKASQFAGSNDNIDKFTKAVTDQGLNKRSFDRLQKMTDRIAGLNQARQLARWVFMTEDIEPGNVSPVFDDGKAYVVATLKAKYEKGFTPLEKAKKQIEPMVIRKKKGEKFAEEFKALKATDINDLSAKTQIKVDTLQNVNFAMRMIPNFGRENELVGDAVTKKTGILYGPIIGSSATFMYVIDSIAEPPSIADYAQYKTQLVSAFKSKVTGNQIFKALEKNAKIDDNRMMFY